MKRPLLYIMFTICILSCCSFAALADNTDSLLQILRSDVTDTTKLKTLNELAQEFTNIGDYDRSAMYANQAIAIIEKIPGSKTVSGQYRKIIYSNKGAACNAIGIDFYYQAHYGEALKKLSEAFTIYESLINDKEQPENGSDKVLLKGKAKALNNIGLVLLYQGNNPEAIKTFFEAISIREKIADTLGIADSQQCIGFVYDNQGNYSEALKNYLPSLKLYEMLHNKQRLANAYNNIGIIYKKQGKFNEALNYYSDALRIDKEANNKEGIATDYLNTGIIEVDQKKQSEALTDYTNALQLFQEIGDRYGVSVSYINLGSLYTDMKKYTLAKNFFHKALSSAKEYGGKESYRDCYSGLFQIDSSLGDFKQALTEYKLFITYRDSLNNQENTKKTVQAQMNYEFDKKTNRMKAEQEKQSAVASAESRRQKIVILLVAASLILSIVFAGFVFRSLQLNKKKNALIIHQKQMVDEKQKEILDSIFYASRIQRALMPTQKQIEKTLKRLTQKRA